MRFNGQWIGTEGPSIQLRGTRIDCRHPLNHLRVEYRQPKADHASDLVHRGFTAWLGCEAGAHTLLLNRETVVAKPLAKCMLSVQLKRKYSPTVGAFTKSVSR